MSAKYAEHTTVTPEKSMTEIMQTLRRYGADGFQTNIDDRAGAHSIVFRVRATGSISAEGYRFVKLVVKIPERDAYVKRALATMARKPRSKSPQQAALEQWESEVRRRWRALALFVKAALEAVESEITTIEQVFLAHLLIGSGTVGDAVLPRIKDAYEGRNAVLELGPKPTAPGDL